MPHSSPLAVRAAAPSTRSTSALSMGFFDNAFKNEDLGKKPDAGGVAKKKARRRVESTSRRAARAGSRERRRRRVESTSRYAARAGSRERPESTAARCATPIPTQTVEVKVLGKPMQAMPGQRLKDIVRASRAPIRRDAPRLGRTLSDTPTHTIRRFNCENGQCGTCEQKVNGRKTRICVTAVPAGGCQITKL